MKKKITLSKKLGTLICAVSFISASSFLQAQESFTLEGEDGATYLSDVSKECPGFSGQKGLTDMKAAFGSYAQFELSDVKTAGTFDLEIAYATVQVRYIYVKVNDQASQVVEFDDFTGGWYGEPGVDEDGNPVEGVKTKTIQVYLDKGDNLIEIGALEVKDQAFAPNIDKLTLTTSATQLPKPTDAPSIQILEAEDANVVNGNAKIKDYIAFSGGKGVGDIRSSDDSFFRFNAINAPEEGTYNLVAYYVTMEKRNMYVKVNDQKKTIAKCNQTTKGWGHDISDDPAIPTLFRKTVQVYLEKGANILEIGAYDGWCPNIDKIELSQTSYVITKPDPEVFASVFDYTDLVGVELSEKSVTSATNLQQLIDNNEHTIYVVDGVSTAEVIAKLAYPICPTGYAIATSRENPVSVADWTVEYSADGTAWTELEVQTTQLRGVMSINVLTNKPNVDDPISAQYYRLTATGNGKVEIGDWQLYGVPYITAEKNFMDDVTSLPGMLSTDEVGFDAGGTWNEVYTNAIDKNAKTKYTVVGKKTFYLQYELDAGAEKVSSYSLSVPATSDYRGRNPRSWKLSGYSESLEDWVVLDSVAGAVFPVTGSTLMYNLDAPDLYSVYKLDVTANNGQDDVHLLQWQLFADATIGIEEEVDGAVNHTQVFGAKESIVIVTDLQAPLAYDVYNLLGQKITSGESIDSRTEIPASAGLYIVRVNNSSTKVVVR